MKNLVQSRRMAMVFVGVLLSISILIFSTMAFGAAEDYRFVSEQPSVKASNGAIITVRLLHVPTNKPVENAVIFRTRLDMSPGGMADMETKVTVLPASEPGKYRFQADVSHDGEWALTLNAKVPGETATVTGKVNIKAVK